MGHFLCLLYCLGCRYIWHNEIKHEVYLLKFSWNNLFHYAFSRFSYSYLLLLTSRRSMKLYAAYIVPFFLNIYTYFQLSVEERQTQLLEGPRHLNPHIKHTEMFHIKTNNFTNKQSHKAYECSDDDCSLWWTQAHTRTVITLLCLFVLNLYKSSVCYAFSFYLMKLSICDPPWFYRLL